MLDQQPRDLGRNHDLHMRSIERVIRTISNRLHVAMTNEEMADIACFSPCHFNRLFHKLIGIPPIQFHYALRMARAKELLIDTDLRITEICFDVGYNSLGTFISRFNELVGISPSAFRRLARRIADLSLADIPLARGEQSETLLARGAISGTVAPCDEPCVVFVGLFRHAIPEGRLSTCARIRGRLQYTLPVPGDGIWHVLSVAVPLRAKGTRLLTLNDFARGRSAPIMVRNERWYGDGAIMLSPPSLLDPPILAILPIQIARLQDDARNCDMREWAAAIS